MVRLFSRLWSRVLVGVMIGVIMMIIRAASAESATYVNPCVSTDPVCERLEVMVSLLEGINSETTNSRAILADIYSYQEAFLDPDGDGNVPAYVAPSGGTTEVAGTVALSEGDRQALDLVWIGIFFMAGISAGFLIGRAIWRELRQWFSL